MRHRSSTPRASSNQQPHESASEESGGAAPKPTPSPEREFVEALLAALTDMAVRSPRRQADLAVALRRSGIEAAAPLIHQALAALEEDGCIEHLVLLTDGGLLMQVTSHGIERLSHTSRRHVLNSATK